MSKIMGVSLLRFNCKIHFYQFKTIFFSIFVKMIYLGIDSNTGINKPQVALRLPGAFGFFFLVTNNQMVFSVPEHTAQ